MGRSEDRPIHTHGNSERIKMQKINFLKDGSVNIDGIPVDNITIPFMGYKFRSAFEAIEFLLEGWQAERSCLLKLRGVDHPGDVKDLEVEERALTARTNELMRKDLGDYMSPNCPVYNGKCRYYLSPEGTRICALREKIDESYGNIEERARCSYNI